jgi:hypothetical protein
MLLSEYSRYLLHRSWYAYPAELPKNAIAEKSKDGKLNRKAMIPLEDIGDGWYKHGTVGQEVYGAGAAPLYASFAYQEVKEGGFFVFSEYLVGGFEKRSDGGQGTVRMVVQGDPRLTACLRLIPTSGRLPQVDVRQAKSDVPLKGRKHSRDLEFTVRGGQAVSISWHR